MYEWRLELLFKYAGNDLNKWQNAIWSKIQTYDGNWGRITHIENSGFIMDIYKKDIHINFSGKVVQFSWHELHYNFKDIEFFPILLENLHEYFNSQNCDVYLNPRSYKLLEEEYQNFEQQDQMEQRSFDEKAIERIELDLLDEDDFLNSDEYEDEDEDDFLNSDEYERELSNFLSGDDYLDSADNRRKYLEEEYFNHQSIESEDELNYLSQDPSYLLSELEKLLSEFEFHEADSYYHHECSEYISYEVYQNKRNQFLQNLKQSLFSQLENLFIHDDYKNADEFYANNCSEYINIEEYHQRKCLFWEQKRTSLIDIEKILSEFKFDEADDYYHYECSEYFSYEVYQNKRNQFLQNLKQSLLSQLEDLFIQDDYKNADKFYADTCSEYINTEEYQQKKYLFWQKKKTFLLKELNELLESDFLAVNDFYQNQCIPFISHVDYQQKIQIFIQSWVQRNNLGNKPDLEQALAIGTVNSHVQVIARAGSGKTSTLVNRAIFLQKHCGVHPSEILLLVFNRKAAQEITDRLKKYLPNDMPHVMTFHALAYAIVHPTENLLFNTPNGGQNQSRALQSVIDDYLRDPNYYEEIKTLMMKRFREDWSKIVHQGFDKSPEEVIKFRRSLTEMGIDGKYYKSYGEKVIADFLFEHNIQFAYERHVWWDGMNYHP